jgi:hypothetical protein
MNRFLFGSLPFVLVFAGCAPVATSLQAGFTQVSVDGDIALAEGTNGTGGVPAQDLRSAFGLGDPQGSPYLRGVFDFGGPVVTASGFIFSEKGRGTLDANFGGLPAATPVASSLDFGVLKLTGSYDFDLGPVTLSPGLAFDVVDLDFTVEELSLGNREEIDEVVGVPMLFLRTSGELGPVTAVGEIGYVEAEIDSSKGSFLEVEAFLEVSVSSRLHLFAGYRYIDFDATGDTGTDSFDVDLVVRGWSIGGGIDF